MRRDSSKRRCVDMAFLKKCFPINRFYHNDAMIHQWTFSHLRHLSPFDDDTSLCPTQLLSIEFHDVRRGEILYLLHQLNRRRMIENPRFENLPIHSRSTFNKDICSK